jgi:hypothetical protein
MKFLLSVVVLALLVGSIECIRWRRTDKNGDEIVRLLKVLKSPLNNFDHVFEVIAGQKNTDTGDVDAIKFTWTTNWVPRHVIRHYMRDENSIELFVARWLLWKIVEYQETDNAAGFDPRTDTKVSQYLLWLRNWTPLTYAKRTVEGSEYHSLCTSLNATQPRPDVTICVSIADRRIRVNRTDPNAVKWSIAISNYPYRGNDTRLALKVNFDSKDIVKDLSESDGGTGATEIDSSNEAALEVAKEDSGARGIASWQTGITVTGNNCSPTGSITRSVIFEGDVQRDLDTFPVGDTDGLSFSTTHRVVYFSFITDCQPESIDWDPEFGVAVDQNGVSGLLPSVLLLAAVVLLQLLL